MRTNVIIKGERLEELQGPESKEGLEKVSEKKERKEG